MDPLRGTIFWVGLFLFLLAGCGTGADTLEVFWENGKKKMEVALNAQGNWEGLARWYFENGTMEREARYTDGILQGPYTLYTETGQLLESGHYDQGLKSGCWQYYFPDTHEGPPQPARTGCYRIYDYGAEQVSRQEGLWRFYHRNGQKIREGYYLENMETGLWREWWPNGQLRSEGVFNFCYLSYEADAPPLLSREKIGIWSYWDETGKPERSGYH